MALNIPNIPRNAVATLFVEDLMQWMLQHHASIHYCTVNAGQYRNFIPNVFNEDVRQAVLFLVTAVENEVDEYFCTLEELSEEAFLDYALYCEDINFKKGFQADCFLEYCVRLVNMTTRFARCDLPQTISICLYIILQLLEDRGMFEGGWDALIEAARKYAQIAEDCCNVYTPETSDEETTARKSDVTPAISSKNEPPAHSSEDESPVYSSDDERQTNSSADSLDMNEENQNCDFVSNRDQLQKPGREFKTSDLLAARKVLQPDRSPKAAANADFISGQALRGTSSIYKLLPSTSKKV